MRAETIRYLRLLGLSDRFESVTGINLAHEAVRAPIRERRAELAQIYKDHHGRDGYDGSWTIEHRKALAWVDENILRMWL